MENIYNTCIFSISLRSKERGIGPAEIKDVSK
jgi:hypothetical protein